MAGKDLEQKIWRLISLWFPVLLQMSLIFYFSAQPKGSPVLESFPVPAGVGHLIGYGLLTFLFYRAFNGGLAGWSVAAARKTFVFALIYAISDEFHQSFVPGREAAVSDVMIDTAGILLALFLIYAGQLAIFRR